MTDIQCYIYPEEHKGLVQCPNKAVTKNRIKAWSHSQDDILLCQQHSNLFIEYSRLLYNEDDILSVPL